MASHQGRHDLLRLNPAPAHLRGLHRSISGPVLRAVPNPGNLDEITLHAVDSNIGQRGEYELPAICFTPDAAPVWKLLQSSATLVNSSHNLIGGFWIVLTNILFDTLKV